MNMNTGRCAACKYLRRRCPVDCIFSPYFPPTNPHRFASVHRIFGASNVGKMLQQLPVHLRGEAAETLYYEAQCRIENPVHGCVGIITQLHEEINNAEQELARAQAQLAVHQPHHHHHQQEIEEAVTGEGAEPMVPGDHAQEVAAEVAGNVEDSDQNEFDIAALMSPSDPDWFY